jgi:integrase/recombinase XerD
MNRTTHYTELQRHYKQWLVTLGFSDYVAYDYSNMLYYFLDYLNEKGIFPATQVQTRHISNYFSHLQSRPSKRTGKALSAGCLNKNFDVVDKFLEFLNQMGCRQVPPPTNYRILQTKEELTQSVKALTKDEIQSLYNSVENLFCRHYTARTAEPRRAIVTLVLDLCYGCGLRRSEAYNLLIEDVDFDKNILFIRQAKGYKDRYVPISEKVCERIKVFVYQHRRYFKLAHKRVFPYSKSAMFHYIEVLQEISGISKDFGLHTLRHSIATHLLQNGMTVENIARFLGHSSLDSTQIYTHLAAEDDE